MKRETKLFVVTICLVVCFQMGLTLAINQSDAYPLPKRKSSVVRWEYASYTLVSNAIFMWQTADRRETVTGQNQGELQSRMGMKVKGGTYLGLVNKAGEKGWELVTVRKGDVLGGTEIWFKRKR